MKVIEKIAQDNKITTEKVREEMHLAIIQSFNNSDKNIQKLQQELFPTSSIPTPEEFILTLALTALSRKNSLIFDNTKLFL